MAETPKDDFLEEFFALRSEEQVIVVSSVAFQDGATHALFVMVEQKKKRSVW